MNAIRQSFVSRGPWTVSERDQALRAFLRQLLARPDAITVRDVEVCLEALTEPVRDDPS